MRNKKRHAIVLACVILIDKFSHLGSLLLESKIQPDTAYQKQQETLIVWSEGDNFDLALSFQEKAGCDEIWEKICQVSAQPFKHLGVKSPKQTESRESQLPTHIAKVRNIFFPSKTYHAVVYSRCSVRKL